MKQSRLSYLENVLRTVRWSADITVEQSMAIIDVENILRSIRTLGALTVEEVEDEY